MDNRKLDVTSEGEQALGMAVRLAWAGKPGGKATHYKIVKLKEKVKYFGNPTDWHDSELVNAEDGTSTLILLWHEEADALPLPYPLEVDEAVTFISGWLKKVERVEEPDHDGSNGLGWRVFTENWGHVAGHHYAIVGVQPEWAMYGK